MRQCWWVCALGWCCPWPPPLSFYTFVGLGIDALEVGETGALLIMITLAKVLLLSSLNIIPVNFNELVEDHMGRDERSTRSVSRINNSSVYQVPEVQQMPCTRRFLCELETIARTSDNYMPKEPEALNGRILEEEVALEEVDPLAEMQIEVVRALYREKDPTGELSDRGKRALAVVEGLTGFTCETAYRLCPGRFSAPRMYWTIFEEVNLVVHEHY
ncbi:hypothetical protein C7M84_013988 [Penaeus vannamei]|uniref:Uncharacterized protein n=1 Tax=Penaeus vannamei TaxID=6689 RepID=A0A3R7SMZ6_PENVA|nr:uncharacterized protein LOC113816944 [Penaeus vannamei]ROT67895.1 hypothetical protein C7M84_013988 [Penaeus vannamei]